ncbi:MAG: acetoacetate decarboxylase family protein [Bifidobacteriaceae bacterium]|jgi:hypothetical protein|nr:acetoacetate decarboxylase family protein [Bifidobacteriaceae bacterium]
MDILEEFDGTTLQNDAQFQGDFYKRFKLTPRQIQLTPELLKEYQFPTFYGDVTCAQAIFLCSYDAALELMPHDKIKPVRARSDKAVLALSCYEYKHVMGIPPYNEIAFTIAVEVDKPKSRVLLPLMFDSYSGYFVFSMPVTSRENCLRGNEIWGLPKVTQRIDIENNAAEIITTAFEDGEEYFRLRLPKSGRPTPMDQTSYLYSKLNGRILKSQTCFQADFRITKNMAVLARPSRPPAAPFITLGQTPGAELLKKLRIIPNPLQLRWAEHMSACFDYYDQSYELR